MSEHILLVEDSGDYQLMVQSIISTRYKLSIVPTLEEARSRLFATSSEYDLVVLVLTLPDGDGLRLCSDLRSNDKTREIPVIILTAKSGLTDKILGLTLGADDYIVKPFEPLELRARIDSKILRRRESRQRLDVLKIANLSIEVDLQKAFVLNDGIRQDLGLTPLELKILYYLAANQERVISRDQLLETVWKNNTGVFDRVADKHISTLRQKLGTNASYIRTVPTMGYVFSVNIQ